MKLLVLPDPHAHPDYDNERFDWLAKFIIKERPDTLLCLGDFADMPSMCSYDKGTRAAIGRTYEKDFNAALDAQERLFKPVWRAQSKCPKSRRWQMRSILLGGNHDEARIFKALDANPEMDGIISLERLQYDKYWDEYHPFKETAVVAGFACSHYFASGLMGRPIGGQNPAALCITKQHMSTISAHSHIWDVALRTSPTGHRLFGLVAGCYTHPKYVEDWCRNTTHLWWNGVHILEGARDGYFDEYRAIAIEKIEAEYRG